MGVKFGPTEYFGEGCNAPDVNENPEIGAILSPDGRIVYANDGTIIRFTDPGEDDEFVHLYGKLLNIPHWCEDSCLSPAIRDGMIKEVEAEIQALIKGNYGAADPLAILARHNACHSERQSGISDSGILSVA